MKRVWLTIFICLFAVFLTLLGGCKVDMNFNDRSRVEYCALHSDQNYHYYRTGYDGAIGGYEYVRIDRATGESCFVTDGGEGGYIPGEPPEESEPQTWERQEGDFTKAYTIPAPPVILDSMDNGWRGYTHVSEENYGVFENLTRKYETDGVEFIHILLTDGGDGFFYGFVNVYDHSTGMLFSGGVAGVSGISYGVLIKYAANTGSTEELLKIDGGCIMAFDGDTALFFKGEKYYSQNVGQDEKYLFDDLAYDRGATSYSSVQVYFNDVHFVVYMHSDDGKTRKNYAYIVGADGEIISSCQSEY